ncbi:MAG: diaminopimelate epimerase [Planctomycetes bacterium]|jgi:diaminopimelate epimerase|nr:diaminopimelate epimerase [Planctomycetota bacterium]
MKFTKMHGCGNDYVYVNCFDEKVTHPAELSRKISDRHFGVGSDGLVLVLPSEVADVRMRMFNPDGSEAEMCGNAIRCVGKLASERGLAAGEQLLVETAAGIKTLELEIENGTVGLVRVNMGRPILERIDVPMRGPAGKVVNEKLLAGGREFIVTCVSMGNPHCVMYVDDVHNFDVRGIGPLIENHEAFPNRTNAEFAQVLANDEVRLRVWERGAGETLACGTGASATCVAGVLTGRTGKTITVHLPGGDLKLEWADDGNVYMTGPAVEVFTGEWPG